MGSLDIVMLVFIAGVAIVAGIGFYINNKKKENE